MTGEVIVPSFTFAATVQALRWLNVTPVFCDADPKTHNIAPESIERLITPRTTGIIGVHLWGQPCDIDALSRIAGKYGVSLLFDSAHAFGSSYNGRPIGGFGTAEVFSFHATKFVNAAEGGAITTDNDELAQKFRATRDFGFDADDRIVGVGTNGKMSELCAAMGLTYLESFDDLIAANHATYEQYRSELANIPGISLLTLDSPDNRNYQYIVTTVDEAATGISRDELLKVLQAENILAKRYFYPGCHRMISPPSETATASPDLPVTEELLRTVLVLPGGASISSDAIRGACAILRLAVENGTQITNALKI
jgi:dTDP-4-amino-4,6-dideoxygalactose transaminase